MPHLARYAIKDPKRLAKFRNSLEVANRNISRAIEHANKGNQRLADNALAVAGKKLKLGKFVGGKNPFRAGYRDVLKAKQKQVAALGQILGNPGITKPGWRSANAALEAAKAITAGQIKIGMAELQNFEKAESRMNSAINAVESATDTFKTGTGTHIGLKTDELKEAYTTYLEAVKEEYETYLVLIQEHRTQVERELGKKSK